MADETYYSLLEIPETASAAEIKSAYRRLIVDVHPDRLLNVSAYVRRLAEEKAKEINEAKEILLDTKRRRSYDEQLATYRTSQAPENGAHPTQSSAPSSSTSSQQQAQSASRSQGTSGTSTGSTQAPGPTSQQHQAASTSKSGFGSGNAMSSKTNSVGLHIRWPFWAWIGVIVLFAIVASVPIRLTPTPTRHRFVPILQGRCNRASAFSFNDYRCIPARRSSFSALSAGVPEVISRRHGLRGVFGESAMA